MPYDVKAKHGELIALLSEQYNLYNDARAAFLSADWNRRYSSIKDEYLVGDKATKQELEEEIAFDAASEDRKKMDEAGMKLHLAVKHTIKHYSYWHAGRIRAASEIRSIDWFLFMTPLCLSPETSMRLEDPGRDVWAKAMAIADTFTAEELKSMSGKQYGYEVFKRANNLLDMKKAQAVG